MSGISTSQAELLLQEHGKNVLVSKSSHPWWKMLFVQFTDVLVLILIGAAIISLTVGEHEDALVILFIVLLNGGIGFFQEFRTEKTLEALKKMVHPEIRVVRDGQEQMLATEFLVPGDLVLLQEGDKIPADGVLEEVHSLKVEESALTGESIPLEKKLGEELFMGTAVARGSGSFVVRSTGMETRFGEIAALTTATEKSLSPLQKELQRIGVFVAKVTGVICLLLFFVALWRDMSLVDALLFSVSVAIAAVPEGLPTTITIALALGASVLAKRKAIIKKLSSVETLGAVSTICSDKTGTLTKNEMTVREIYLADRSLYQITGAGYEPSSGMIRYMGGRQGENIFQKNPPSPLSKGGDNGHENTLLRDKLLRVCSLCNEAKLVQKDGRTQVLGDPTEGSLLTLVAKAHYETTEERVELFPFDSDRKMMSILTKEEVLVKGSPDQVLEQCTHWTDGQELFPLDAEKRQGLQQHYTRMAEGALRVLAFAERSLEKPPASGTPLQRGAGGAPESAEEAEQDLVFLGFVGMIDPPRDDVYKAVTKAHAAGIRIVVITGDYGVTAEAIARELGIVQGKDVMVLTGDEVQELSDEQLSEILADRQRPVLFARSMPAQKMRIVRLLQEHGEVVAMTGDGVNDAPALKKADIGVAMGITGTEVSKEAATMILMNDSFASIVRAVHEGRRIYTNLKKFVWFIFSSNIAELFVILAAIFFMFPLPLTAILILCVNLGTDILPAIALGVDPAEKGIMQEPPRKKGSKILTRSFVRSFLVAGAIMGAAVLFAFLWTLLREGWEWGDATFVSPHAMSVAFAALVLVQLGNALVARSPLQFFWQESFRENSFLVLSLLSSTLLLLLLLYVPFFNAILGTTPLDLLDWILILLVSLVSLGFLELKKWFRRRKLHV